MPDLSTLLPQMAAGQANDEATFNQLFDAASPATLFGRHYVTSAGLTFGGLGGRVIVNGAETLIANWTVTLTVSATNYIECTQTGTPAVSVNTTAHTPGRWKLYTVTVNGSGVITGLIDHRASSTVSGGVARLEKALPSNANYPLLADEAQCNILDFIGGATLTATRNIVVPLAPRQWTVFNNTAGGQSIQVIGATGTGITIATTKTAIVYADGTNVRRASPDV